MDRRKLRSIIILVGLTAALALITLSHQPGIEEVNYAGPGAPDTVQKLPPPPPAPLYAGIIGKNTSFFDLMLQCGITPIEIKEVEKTAKRVYDFRRIYPGQHYEFYADSIGHLERLTFSINDESYVDVTRDNGTLCAERKEYPFEVERKTASGLIAHSLFTCLQEQSLPIELGLQLSDIFAWDIDFFTDLRKNDYFRFIYEEKTRFDGLKKIGRILAAEFNTKGENHYAFLFENEEDFPDYFDETGRSLRKQLLKAPLSYTRISSSFKRRRYHPVLHHYAPHFGIDYAAPAGTPIMTTGDGTVMTASRTRANGNYIKVRHNHNYITYYLHLSRFAKGMRPGVKVEQGQVIGYVGSTGYSTGPHLDYRVKKNGRFVNPRSLKLPPAKPVSEENKVAFAALRDGWLIRLAEIPIRDWRTEYFADYQPPSTPTGITSRTEEGHPTLTQ